MQFVRLRFSAASLSHIEAIYQYISEDNRSAASAVVRRKRAAAERLCIFPLMGRKGEVPGTFEWVVRGLPYIIVYEVRLDPVAEVIVLGVFHGAQDRWRGAATD